MKNQIKIKFIVTFLVFVFLSSSNFVNAQAGGTSPIDSTSSGGTNIIKPISSPANPSSGIFTLQNPLRSDIDSVGALVQAFIEIITYIAIIFAVLAFIWVGFQYVTSAATGNASKIKELHKQLMWLVIGVAIVIAARVIIQIVINTISATGTVSPTVIQSANDALQGK